MMVTVSALHGRCPLPPGTFLVFISVKGSVVTRARVQLEGWLVAKHLNQPHCGKPHKTCMPKVIYKCGPIVKVQAFVTYAWAACKISMSPAYSYTGTLARKVTALMSLFSIHMFKLCKHTK
jgi:hypothetical protein